ncbi:MAG: strictosidine synthase [Desulfobacterales bacterium CG23_combo_of_CG06-09_8_20_14_all_51_8]|nr:MAG: strictosidine synthase [Desulfobacterales bacterium CG23_combo_of_CG06-09_8_20_14_all_51_8]
MKKIIRSLAVILILIIIYLVTWPVPIDPVAWEAPPDPGYTGPFEVNTRLAGIEKLPLGDTHGPEDIALDADGRIYAATHEGFIVRMENGGEPEKWVNTGGRPLGIDFDGNGNLIVADSYIGLLSIAPNGKITPLVTSVDGIPLGFTDDVDVAADGKIYFSDASSKFIAKTYGTMAASLLDLMEHGANGRLIVYDPATGKASTLISGLSFANGVAVSPDQSFVLINETGNYRVLRYWIAGPQKGTWKPLIESLPAFPDNISTGFDGRFWVALVSPRNPLLDSLAGKPFIRKMIQRLPEAIKPKAVSYGHIIAINGNGEVVADLQDPAAACPINTGVTETQQYLYIGSLATDFIARLPKDKE